MENKNKTGFTKTGFSKAGFACCSHWKECNYGRKKCFYEDKDPEVMEYCFCYIRNHSKQALDNEDTNITTTNEKEENTEEEQLSLF